MKRLLLAALIGAALIAGASSARAQPTGEAERGPGATTDEAVQDPSRHFNFFSDVFSYRDKDEMGGTLGDGVMHEHGDEGPVLRDKDGNPEAEEPMSAPFIFMLINFAILIFILAKYGGPVARKLAEERHDAIKTALDEASRLRDEAAAKLEEYEVRLKDSDAEIKKLVDGMRADAEAEKARILAAAEAQAVTMKREAESRIAAEIQAARATLTREVTAAAAAATEKLLRERATPDDQNRLVATFLSDMQLESTQRVPTRPIPKEPV